MKDNFLPLLEKGFEQMQWSFSSEQKQRLLAHVVLLEKWNAVYNLTSRESGQDWVTLHLIDSLSIYPHLKGDSFLDMGSGAGFPGIPLAIVYPERHFVLLESRKKKAQFLSHVQKMLGLDNVEVVHSRAEDFKPNKRFSGIMARAVGSPQYVMGATNHLIEETGQWYLMLGMLSEPILKQMGSRGTVIVLKVPGKDMRHLLVVNQNESI